MATIRQNAASLLGDLRAINHEIDRASGANLPGVPGRPRSAGTDRPTALALGQIMRGINGIRRELEPSAADERSLL